MGAEDGPAIRPVWHARSRLIVSRDLRARRLDADWLVHFRANAPANLAFAVSDGAFSAVARFGSGAVVADVIEDWGLAERILTPLVEAGLLLPSEYEVWGEDALLSAEEISNLRALIPIEALGLLELESLLLYLLARDNPRPGPICELGSFLGGSSIALALGARRSLHGNRVVAIDDHEWHRHIAEDVSPEYASSLPSTLPAYLSNIRRASLNDQIQVMVSDSVAAAGEIQSDLSLLLVDAAHDERSIRADIQAWLPKLVAGGVVAFHDYHSSFWPDVEHVVDALVKKIARSFVSYQTLAIATLGSETSQA